MNQERMQIAFFVSEFPTTTETFIINQISDLKQRGYSITIFTHSGKGTAIIHNKVKENALLDDCIFLDKLPSGRIRKLVLLFKKLVLNLSPTSVSLVFRLLLNASSLRLSVYDLIHFLDKRCFNVVHAHFGVNGNYVAKLRRLGLFEKSFFVTTFHGYDLEVGEMQPRYYQQLFETCDVYTVNSNFSRSKLISIGAPENKIVKLPVGLDTAFFKTEDKVRNVEKPFVILFVGRLVPFKGPDLVVEICAILKKRAEISFCTLIAGEGELRDELEEKIKQSQLHNDVFLVGPKSQLQIRDLMASADIFLYPGRTHNGRAENQGLVLQEAQAMGLPVILSDAGGMGEGVIDGLTGYVINEHNLNGFADKIILLANDSRRKHSMAEQGRKFVEKNFSIKSLNDRMLSIYQGTNENETKEFIVGDSYCNHKP